MSVAKGSVLWLNSSPEGSLNLPPTVYLYEDTGI